MTENGNKNDDQSDVLPEIRELRVEPDPNLEGRVRRDINRRTLTGDSLDFSLNVMLQTFWDHLHSLIDVWPSRKSADDETNE